MRYTLLSILALFFALQLAHSENQGINTWTLNYSNSGRVYGMVVDPNNQNIMYHVGLDSGVYKTVNSGISWFPVNNGIVYKGAFCIAIAPSNSNVLYVGTDQNGATSSGVYVSTDAGGTWTLRNSGIVETSLGIQQIVVHPSNPAIAFMTVFDGVTASTNGVYKTTNYGANWVAASTGMTNKNILSLLINPKNPNVMYAGSSLILPASTGPSNMFKSYDGGATWSDISNGLPTNAATGDPIRALSMSSVDTSRVLAALFTNDTAGGAYLTTNGGQLWVKKSNGLIAPGTTGNLLRSCIIRPGTTNEFYIGLDQSSLTTPKGVYRTTDGGNTWTDFNSGAMVNTYPVRSLVFKTVGDTTLYAGGANTTMPGRGIFEYSWPSPLISGVWSEQTSGLATALNSISAVDDNVAWACGDGGKVVRTTNKGVTWTDVSSNIPITNPLYDIFAWDANLAITTASPTAGGSVTIYKTTNGGANWTTGLSYTGSVAFGDDLYMTDPNNGFFIGDPQGGNWQLLKTTNGGNNWVTWATVPTSNTNGTFNHGACFNGQQVWFSPNGDGIMQYTSNMGANWSTQTIPLTWLAAIYFINSTTGYAGGYSTSPGLIKTTNSGTNWATITSPYTSGTIAGITGAGDQIWAASMALTVSYSSNAGTSWIVQYTVTTGSFYHIVKARNGTTLWGVRSNGGISRYGTPLVGITPITENTPVDYKLSQNYPNPFNPVTKINFEVPQQGLVTLKVYDIMGREITTLVNEVKSPGSYNVDFDASRLSSGTYFYKLISGNFVETKKMLLIK
jgi:photosystem II stability/assembly factor-like uncharacterized protein